MLDPPTYRAEPDPEFADRLERVLLQRLNAKPDGLTSTVGVAQSDEPGRTDTDDREGDLIVLKTEGRPTGDQLGTPIRRAPGRWLLVAAAAVVVAAVGTLLATARSEDDAKQINTVTSTPATTTTLESPEQPASFNDFGTQLDAILERAAGWATSDQYPTGYDYAFNGPCSGKWGEGAAGGGDGGAPGRSGAGMGSLGFPTAAQASDAAARFVENLNSCTTTEWRTQPIAGTGAVLASSADAVAWIQRTGDTVDVLQVTTADGPPPDGVQVEVADWMVAYRTWQEQN